MIISPSQANSRYRRICRIDCIARRFEVNRATASKAVSRLVSDGVLKIRKGAGTSIRSGVLDYDLRQLVSFTEKARAAGKKPKTKVLEFHETTAVELGNEWRSQLKVERDDNPQPTVPL